MGNFLHRPCGCDRETLSSIEQLVTPWSDGVPGLSQRAIEPGHQFFYKWKAAQYGSYFYHAHRRGQIDDGLYGPIHILADYSVERPFGAISKDIVELHAMLEAERNSEPIIISDWRLLTSEEVWQTQEDSGLGGICTNALLINGKGSVQCLSRERIDALITPIMKLLLGSHRLTDTACMPPINSIQGAFEHNNSAVPQPFQSGCTPSQGPTEVLKVNPASRWVSWDLITAAGISMPIFSVDGHTMYVYAIDGRYIEPLPVNAITTSLGARYSVLVRLDQPSGDYTIRVPHTGVTQIINATAIMSYTSLTKTQKEPSKPYVDIVGSNTTADTVMLNETHVVPFPVEFTGREVDRFNASYRWTLGNSSFPMSLEDSTPLLFNRSSIPTDLTISTRNGTWVDIIMPIATPMQPPHPIHKHSNKYFVIGQGTGAFDYDSVAEAMEYTPESFNLKNPQIRDTFLTPPAQTGSSWLAIRYQVVNPGPFLLHCHIQIHFNGGVAMALMDGADAWPVPEGYKLPALEE